MANEIESLAWLAQIISWPFRSMCCVIFEYKITYHYNNEINCFVNWNVVANYCRYTQAKSRAAGYRETKLCSEFHYMIKSEIRKSVEELRPTLQNWTSK